MKAIIKGTTLTILLAMTNVSFGAIGDVWDLLGDFSTTSNPNVTTAQVDPATWSYHDGRPGGTFGNLLSAGNNPWGGSDPGWVNASPTGESGVFPIPNSNFPGALGDLYGHGPHLIKWTSPVAGTVSVTGVLEQLDSSQRHMGWALSKNGGLVAEASIFPTNNAEELNAF